MRPEIMLVILLSYIQHEMGEWNDLFLWRIITMFFPLCIKILLVLTKEIVNIALKIINKFEK